MLPENEKAIERFRTRLMNTGHSFATIGIYLGHVSQFLEFIKKPYKSSTLEDVDNFITYKRVREKMRRKGTLGFGRISTVGAGNLKPETLNVVYSALRGFFSELEVNRLVKAIKRARQTKWIPKIGIEPSGLMKMLEEESVRNGYELKRKKDTPIDEFLIRRDCLLIEFLFATGARTMEARALEKGDIKTERKVPEVFLKGKGSKERYVAVGNFWVNNYRKFIELRNDASQFVFTTKSGGQLSFSSIKHIVRQASIGAGLKILKKSDAGDLVKSIGPHKLRHAYATYRLLKGDDVVSIQNDLGHSSLDTTGRYMNIVNVRRQQLGSPLDDLKEKEKAGKK